MVKFKYFFVFLLFVSNVVLGQIKINEIQPTNTKTTLDPQYGKTADWIELYNTSTSSVNVSGYYITDDASDPRKWAIPTGTTIASKGYLLIWADGKASGLHTNYKLSSSGEKLKMFSSTMLLLDTVTFGAFDPDVVYGRKVDGTGTWDKLSIPTPGKANNATIVKGIAPKPTFSVIGGFYSSDQTVTLSTTISGAVIRYTTDGSEPTSSSTIYSTPIVAKSTNKTTQKYGDARNNNTGIQKYGWPTSLSYPTNRYMGTRDYGFVIKAKVFHADYVPSNCATSTYFINLRKPTLPIVSMCTHFNNFFNADSGIYIQGVKGLAAPVSSSQTVTANWNQDWEREVTLEYFDANGAKKFDISAGVQTMGAVSRNFDLKSLVVAMKSKYEDGKINYSLFGANGLNSYQAFLLRSSGNDWESGNMARDAIIQAVLKGQVDLEVQAYQPVVMYLNGEYWSLINMQERYDAEYFAGYHSYVDPDKIDILKIDGDINKMIPSDGDSARFEEMMIYLRANSMTDQANYDYVKSHYIDVSNMMNYYIAELYCQNTDWPKNNFRMWRPRTENGKFRFPLYDTDFGYGYWGGGASDNPYSNFNSNSSSIVVEMFKYMMLNPDFKSEFIQRFSYMLNTTYSSSRLTTIANNIESAIATERDTYTNAEWTRSTGVGYNTDAMISWGSSRIGNMRTFLNSEYGSKGWQTLTVNYTASQGLVTLSGLKVSSGYSALQYASTPIRLNAIPADGYQFVGWKNGATTVSTNQEYQLSITAATTISAVFEARPTVNTLKINEILTSNQTINTNPLGKYEDWIELHNSGTTSIDIAGLYLSDNSLIPTLHQIPYGFPTQTTIPPGGFLLFWADGASEEGVLHLPFKLNKDGDTLLLSQKGANGTITSIDKLIYGKQNTDISYGRYPDDNANKIIFSVPTPNASNEIQSTTFIDGLKITEFMAKNATIIKEETGSYADYIEIYNSNSTPIDIGGLFVTNDLSNPNMYMIPKGMSSQTTIAAKGYYLLWADKQIEINPNHVDFNLNAEKGSIAIVQNRGALNYTIDQISYTNQGEDIAYGIFPVGSTTWKYLVKPTPGAENKNDSIIIAISGITINECLALNTKTKADELGQFDDYIEFYNANTTDVNLGGLFVSDTGTYTLKYRIPRDNATATTIKAGQWLTFWADNNLSQGSLHLGFDLSSAGEELSLSQVTQNGIVQLDTLTFGKQTNDVSYGRFPEKSANKELMTPSFNVRNTSATDIAILKSITSTIGTLTNSIQSTVFSYKFLLPEGATAIPVISAASVNSSASISIVQAQSVNDVATITVTSPSGLYTNVYTISFGIQVANDASLLSLSVANSTLIPTFSSTVYYYTANTTSFLVPLVTAIPTSANAVVSILYATSLTKNTVITVTAEGGDKKEYVISHLFTPTAISQWTDNFDDNVNQNVVPSLASGSCYTITESSQQLTAHFVRLKGAVNNDYFSYKIPQGFVVSANPTLYVNFDAICTENKLETANTNIALRVEVVDFNGNTSDLSAVTSTISATKTTFNLDFTGALTSSAGTVDKTKITEVRFYFEYQKNDKDRDKTAVIDNLVIGPLTAAVLSTNANLATLTSNIGSLSPTFTAATTSYTLTLPAGTAIIPTISATVAQANASIQISQSSKLDGTATIRVVAQDKVTIKTYTIKLVQTPTVVEGYIENIVRPDIPGWTVGNTTYSVAYNAGALDINYNRTATSGNNSITFNLANEAAKYLNLTNYPYFAIKAKTSTPITLRVDYFDVNGNITNSSPVTVAMSGNFDSIYVFTFTNKFTQTAPTATVDITKIYGVKIYFDAGTTATKTGTVSLDKLMFGSEVVFALNFPPVISSIPSQSIMQGQTFSNILLDSYVADDNTIDSKLKWTATTTTNLTMSIVGNIVTIIPKVSTWLGTETVTFTCTDEEGLTSSKTVSFTITELKIPITGISFIQSSVNVAKSATANVKNYLQINPTNASILSTTWSSDNANVTVDANGLVTNNIAFGTETAIISVTIADKSNNTYTSTISVVATGCPTALSSVMLSQNTASIVEKLTLQLTSTLTPSTACVKSYSYTSSNTSVANVSSTGLITALVPGTSVITVAYNDGFSVKSATCSLTVAPTPVTSITLTPSTSTTLTVGSILTISSVVAPTAAPDKSLSWSSSDIDVVSVNGSGVITAVKVGTAIITATSVQNQTVSTTLLVNVTPVAVTSITFNPDAATSMTVGGTQTITAVIAPTNATDKSINWTTSDASLATVSTTGFVTALKAGTVTITATSVQYSGISQKAIIVISDIMPASISISPVGTQTVFVGSSVSLTATILPANAANQLVTWTSSDATIAYIDANGKVSGLKVGTVSIIVTSNAVTTVKATSSIIVNPVAVSAIAFNPALITTMTVGETQSLTAEITPTNATDKFLNWSTSDASFATISTSGVVSALKAGTVTITCTSVQNPSVKQSGIITISDILPSSITLLPNNTQTVNVGASLVITHTILPNNAANQSVTWSSSDVNIATVDGTGKINGLKAGTVTITATSNAVTSVKSSLTVVVNNVLISTINVTPTSLNLIIGQATQLTASIAPSTATLKTFKWTTSDNSKVTIDASGTINAIALGTVTITATADDAGAVKGTCIVIVKPVMPVSIAAGDISLLTSETAGKTITYSFTPDSTTNKAVSFNSLNTNIATVDATGLVKPVGVGSTTITITSIADGTIKKVINVTVTATIYNIISVTVNPVSVILSPNKTQTVTTTLNPVNASVNTISWTSDNGSVATVDGNGVITAVAPGTANITVTVSSPAASKSATVAVTVQAILVSSITLDQTSLSLTTASTPATSKATVLPFDATNPSVQWTSDNTDVVTVSQAGVVSVVGLGTATITCSAKDASTKSASCLVTVTNVQPTSVLTSVGSLALNIGETLTISASVVPSNAPQGIVWSISNNTIATINSNGTIVALKAGTTTIKATSEGLPTIYKNIILKVSTVPVTSILLDQTALTLNLLSTSTKIAATVNPLNATDISVTWSVTPAGIVSVTGGVISVQTLGSATLTCSANDGSGVKATCIVNVTNVDPVSISVDSTSVAMKIGTTCTLHSTILPSLAPQSVTWSILDNTIATLDANGKIVALKAGSTTITATSTVLSSVYKSIPIIVSIIPVTSISLDKTSLIINLPTNTASLIATITPPNATNGNVTWSTNNSTIATVDASGNVSILTDGDVVITASTSNGLTASCSIKINPIVASNIIIDYNTLSLNIGDSKQLNATVLPSNTKNKSVIWTTLSSTVATVNSTGNVQGLSEGTAIIRATTSNGIVATCNVTVSAINAISITLSKSNDTLFVYGTDILTATILPVNTTNKVITWNTSDSKVATINNGTITAVSSGYATIIASTINGIIGFCNLVVKDIEPTAITAVVSSTTMNIGTSQSISVIYTPTNVTAKSISYNSNNPLIASVDNNGVITANSAGDAIITLVTPNGIIRTISIKVNPIQVSSVSLNLASVTLLIQENQQLLVNIYPTNASDKSVVWSSSDANIASVDNFGKITALKVGSASIRVTATSGINTECIVKVVAKTILVESVTVNPKTITLNIGQSQSISATVLPIDATNQSLIWTSNLVSVVSVDQTGKITANAIGQAKVIVSSSNGINDTVTVNVIPIAVQTVSVDLDFLGIGIGESQFVKAQVLPSNATNKFISWSSSNTTIASISSTGRVTGNSVGTIYVFATSLNGIKDSCKVIVSQLIFLADSVILDATSVIFEVDNSTKVSGTIYPSNTSNKSITWIVEDASIVSVDVLGNITALSVGKTNVIAITSNGKTDTLKVTVLPTLAESVTIDKLSAVLNIDDTLLLSATVLPAKTNDKTVTWTSSNTAIVTVNQAGIVTALKAGSAIITATASNIVSSNCEITVSPMLATSITISSDTTVLEYSKSTQLSVVIAPLNVTDNTVIWSSSDITVANVDANGKVTAVGYGLVSITATTVNGVSSKCVVKIDLNNTSPQILAIPEQKAVRGKTFTNLDLSKYVTDDNTAITNILWSANTSSHISMLINSKGIAKIVSTSATWVGSETVTVYATDEQGLVSSIDIKITVESDVFVDEITNNEVSVYPNPTTGKCILHYSISNALIKSISVYNVLGEKIVVELLNGNSYGDKLFDFSKLAKGIYFIVLSDGKSNYQTSLIIE